MFIIICLAYVQKTLTDFIQILKSSRIDSFFIKFKIFCSGNKKILKEFTKKIAKAIRKKLLKQFTKIA